VDQDSRALANAVTALQKSIIRIETKLEIHSDHEARIRSLEQGMARNAWISSLLTAGLTAAVVTIANLAITGGI